MPGLKYSCVCNFRCLQSRCSLQQKKRSIETCSTRKNESHTHTHTYTLNEFLWGNVISHIWYVPGTVCVWWGNFNGKSRLKWALCVCTACLMILKSSNFDLYSVFFFFFFFFYIYFYVCTQCNTLNIVCVKPSISMKKKFTSFLHHFVVGVVGVAVVGISIKFLLHQKKKIKCMIFWGRKKDEQIKCWTHFNAKGFMRRQSGHNSSFYLHKDQSHKKMMNPILKRHQQTLMLYCVFFTHCFECVCVCAPNV